MLTGTHVTRAEGGDWLEQVVVAGPDGQQTLEASGMFVLIGGIPMTAGVEDWLRSDTGGYLMTGPELYAEADRSWWPLARDPLFLVCRCASAAPRRSGRKTPRRNAARIFHGRIDRTQPATTLITGPQVGKAMVGSKT